ncbi:MAG: helix-turn-helix domain-containing protein, partial [Mycobacterium sp.]|uniref:helix-turn-helix domain-containing protein n=1 Tax=Mycobacterium sp. TaxID=1785 RepID=UPI003CC69899
PVTHLRNVRLDSARRMLTQPSDGTSVTNVALAAGFSHLGRFSREYSRRFGELPSESLRRALATN